MIKENKGQFKKGQTAWNKGKKLGFIPKGAFKKGEVSGKSNPFYGKKHTEISKEINRLKHLGKSTWNKGLHIWTGGGNKKGCVSSFKGKKHSEKTIKIISQKNKGKHYSANTEFKKGVQVWNKDTKGMMPPVWNKGKEFKAIQKEKHWNWQGGVTPKNITIRMSREYKDWRTKVFQRDNYTCQECGNKGVTLQADHIKPFAYFPELRLVIDNGRTLCVPCHKKTENYLVNNFRDKTGKYITNF